MVPQIGAGSGSNSSKAIRTIRSGSAVSGARSPKCRGGPGAAADPTGADHRLSNHASAFAGRISDAAPLPMLAPVPAPAPPGTGGIVLRSPTGAMIVVNDAGIFINNGKGASIEMVGTERDDQQSSAGGDVMSRRSQVPVKSVSPGLPLSRQ